MKKFVTPTQFAFRSRSSVKFRFRFSRWFQRLAHVRYTEQQLQPVVVLAADAAAVVQLQLHQLADHVVVVAAATNST